MFILFREIGTILGMKSLIMLSSQLTRNLLILCLRLEFWNLIM